MDSRKKNIKIIISSDYLDKWIELKPIKNYKKYTPIQLIKIIHQAGVIGLGGGQFSSAKKLMLSIDRKVHTLIVNGVESEPWVTADNCLMKNYTQDILTGCKIISWISKITIVLIAIQEDKIESTKKMFNLIKNQSLFKICIIKKKYPGGSSKVLIKSLIGKEIPYQQHAIDIGYLVFNVATVYAIKQAIINGEPLIQRVITFLGDKTKFSGNFWIRIGTPVKYLLNNKKIEKNLDISIYFGGPFMGKEIFDLNYSILKNVNCIQIQSKRKISESFIEYECIRCSYCTQVCPVNLLPQQLYLYSKHKNHEQAKKHHILDCIECKACEKVCPSYIPLVKYFKSEKNIQNSINIEINRKKISLFRFKARETRLLNAKKITNKNNIFEKIHSDKIIRKQLVLEAIKRVKLKKQDHI